MTFYTEVDCGREALVDAIACDIPAALARRLSKPKQSKYTDMKHILPTQSPSPLDARQNDFYVFKRMSRMLDSEFPKKIGCDPLDPLEGLREKDNALFRAVPKGASVPNRHVAPMPSPNLSKAKKLLQDALAWEFQYSEALTQSQFLESRESKLAKSGRKQEILIQLSDSTSRSDIKADLRMLSGMTIISSDESDDAESANNSPKSPSSISENSPKGKDFFQSFKTLRRSALNFGRSPNGNLVSSLCRDENDTLLSSTKQKRALLLRTHKDSRTIRQLDASDPDSDETDTELAEMKKILETAKCRPFSDSRRSVHDEINPYGNSDFLNEYVEEHERSLSRLQDRKKAETDPKAKKMHVKKEKFRTANNAFFQSLKQEIDNPKTTTKTAVKSHLSRPRQLDENPGYEYQRYCELNSIPILKQIALKKDDPEMFFVNNTISGLPQATAVAHFFQNTTELRKLVIDSCSIRGLELNVISIALGKLKTLSSLTLIGANFSNQGPQIKSSFEQLTCLTELSVRNCKLNDFDCAKLITAIKPNLILTKICLAENCIGARTCNAIGGGFCDPWIKWTDIDLSWNHIQGLSPLLMLGCLEKSYTVQSIDLSWNGMRHETSLFAFCNALSTSNCVKFAKLAHCEISDYGALLIVDLLRETQSLTELNLLHNPIHTFGCRSILRTLGLRKLLSPGLKNIRVLLPLEEKAVMQSTFDIESLTGKVKLDLGLPSHRHILKHVVKRKEKGSASVVPGSLQYKGELWQIEKLVEDAKSLEMEFLKKLSDDVERVWNCAQESVPEPQITIINPVEESVLFIPMAKDEDEEQISVEDDTADLPTEDGASEGDSVAHVGGKKSDFIAGLKNNTLTFTLITNRIPSSKDNIVTAFEIEYFTHLLETIDLTIPGNSIRQYAAVLMLFSGSNVIKTDDIVKLLNQICDDYKVHATKLSLTRCLEPGGMEKILANLSKTEYTSLSKMVSGSILKFTPNNPTGKYSLRLSEQLDRDFVIRLIEKKNFEDGILNSDPIWQSYRYHNMERNFLNVTLDGKPLTVDHTWVVPLNGTLSLDFVSHIPPTLEEYPLATEKNILELVIGPQDESEKLNMFRKWTNSTIFTIQQAIRLLQVFSGDDNRVEFCVTVFNRLLDWHGRLRLFQHLSNSANQMLTSRIGTQNLWDDVSAVRFHEYDLSNERDRFCAGRLVDLAVLEPGENMCYEHFNEREFQCPASWSNDDIPKKGTFSVYYCRSDRVISGIIGRCPSTSIPPNFTALQPSGQEWVELHKRNRLRSLIRDRFPDPKMAFLVMDESGDGSLTRKEFARGMRLIGVELKAHEMANLMELLDDDGGGEIDSEEFVAFVNATD